MKFLDILNDRLNELDRKMQALPDELDSIIRSIDKDRWENFVVRIDAELTEALDKLIIPPNNRALSLPYKIDWIPFWGARQPPGGHTAALEAGHRHHYRRLRGFGDNHQVIGPVQPGVELLRRELLCERARGRSFNLDGYAVSDPRGVPQVVVQVESGLRMTQFSGHLVE